MQPKLKEKMGEKTTIKWSMQSPRQVKLNVDASFFRTSI
jgi:hypothetical protein